MLQNLFYLTTALHVSGVTIAHLREHKTAVTTASGNRYTVLLSAAIVGELELSVLWVVYATHSILKSIPTHPRLQQTTVWCNGYQMP